MLFMNVCAAVKIRNRAGNLEDAGVGAGGETETVSDHFEESVAGGVRLAELFDETGSHLGVTVDFGAFVSLQLQLAGTRYPLGYGGGAFGFTSVGQIAVFDGRHFDVDVDPVQERPGDAGTVAVDRDRGAGAGVGRLGSRYKLYPRS
jgi:hypothetical protein